MKTTYQAPVAELLTIKCEEGILTFSNGVGKASGSVMTQDDTTFEDWD